MKGRSLTTHSDCNAPRVENGKSFSFYSSYHIYQRSIDRSRVFISTKDALAFILILRQKAIKFGIEIYALCLMHNHIHLLARTLDKKLLCRFVNEYTSVFSRAYNKEHNRRGPLFSKMFGRSLKYTDKYIRSCIAYIFNNPVEAKICNNAKDYIWNLLAFGYSSHPFSLPVRLSQSRIKVRKAVKEIKGTFSRNEILNYTQLEHLFSNTNREEKQSLRDYILSLYNPIDYSAIKGLFGNIERAITAFKYITGAEYNINEDD